MTLGPALTLYCQFPTEMEYFGDRSCPDDLKWLDVRGESKPFLENVQSIFVAVKKEYSQLAHECDKHIQERTGRSKRLSMTLARKGHWYRAAWTISYGDNSKRGIKAGFDLNYDEKKNTTVCNVWLYCPGGRPVEQDMVELLKGAKAGADLGWDPGEVRLATVELKESDGSIKKHENIVKELTAPIVNVGAKNWKKLCELKSPTRSGSKQSGSRR